MRRSATESKPDSFAHHSRLTSLKLSIGKVFICWSKTQTSRCEACLGSAWLNIPLPLYTVCRGAASPPGCLWGQQQCRCGEWQIIIGQIIVLLGFQLILGPLDRVKARDERFRRESSKSSAVPDIPTSTFPITIESFLHFTPGCAGCVAVALHLKLIRTENLIGNHRKCKELNFSLYTWDRGHLFPWIFYINRIIITLIKTMFYWLLRDF